MSLLPSYNEACKVLSIKDPENYFRMIHAVRDRKERNMIVFTRISFLQHILSFLTSDIRDIARIIRVHTSWRECVDGYMEITWKKIFSCNYYLMLRISYRGFDFFLRQLIKFCPYEDKKEFCCRIANSPRISPEIISLMLECGFDLSLYELLHRWCDDEKIMQVLLEHGGDPNSKNLCGETLLHCTRNINSLKLLIKYGANVNMTSRDGYTPLDKALACHRKDVAEILRENGGLCILLKQ